MGSAQSLPNDNVLICNASSGQLFEVDVTKHVVWDYVNPIDNGAPIVQGATPYFNSVYKCLFYPSTYPAFTGRALETGLPLELSPLPYSCKLYVSTPEIAANSIKPEIFPNPSTEAFEIKNAQDCSYILMDITGKILSQGTIKSNKEKIDLKDYNSGMYMMNLVNTKENSTYVLKLVKQ